MKHITVLKAMFLASLVLVMGLACAKTEQAGEPAAQEEGAAAPEADTAPSADTQETEGAQ